MIEGGRVFLPQSAHWLDDFVEETQAFPNGKNDDQVDALSLGLDVLSKMSGFNQDAMNLPIELSASLNNNFQSGSQPNEWKDKLASKASTRFVGWGEL